MKDQDAPIANNPIIVTGVIILQDANTLLTVRKRGTSKFMLPGGKPEPGETPVDTGIREVREELGLELAARDLQVVGTFRVAAANEPGRSIESTLLQLQRYINQPVRAAAEIAELRWLDLRRPVLDRTDLAPLVTERVLPHLFASGYGTGSGAGAKG